MQMNPEPVKTRKAASAYLAVIFVIAAFLWGYSSGSNSAGDPENTPVGSGTSVEIVNGDARELDVVDFNQFWEMWDVIKERYVRQPVDERKMFYGAMAGAVASLEDPHSIFLDPQLNEEFTAELSGKFEGIGAEIGIKKTFLVIVSPLAGSPAEKAGLQPGDRVLAIDEVDTAGMTLDEAVSRIRGDKGTKVKLHILRGDEAKPRVFEIVRNTIRIESVKYQVVTTPKGKRIAIITVTNFNSDTAEKFIEASGKLKAAGVEGLILDLRGNPGGYLDAAISMLGEWAPGEVVVSERYADNSKEEHAAAGLGRLKDVKTLVLVNGGSASASEIVAGALQDLKRGTLLGTQTFGKGSVQDLVPLKDGASVKLTIAEWLTPAGRHIDQNGVTPDYNLERADDEYDNDIDSQLDAAKAWFDGVEPKVTPAATSTDEVFN